MSETVTREEQYLAAIAGLSQEVPAEPVTRKERFYAAILERMKEQAISNVATEHEAITDSTDGNVIHLNNKGYTQQEGTPSPDAPIHINGLADKGYFDGVLQQGYYNYGVGDTASFVSSSSVVCNKNYIACKSGDTITLEYETNATLRTIFVDKNMKSLSTSSLNGTKITVTAPENTKYFLFVVGESNITPSTAKHISVTINGRYALRVKTSNKNIASKVTYNSTTNNYSSLLSGVGARIEKGKTYTVSVDLTADASTQVYWNGDSKIFAAKYINISSGTKRYSNTFEALADASDASSMILLSKSGTSDGVRISSANLQIEEGNTATPFVEHQESEALIPTSSPFYEDDFIEVYADGSGQIVREVVDMAKVGDWYKDGSSGDGYRYSRNLSVGYKAIDEKMYSTHYPQKYVTSYNNVGDYIENHESANKISVRTTNADLSTADKFMAWLEDNNVQILVKRATPTTEPLTAEQVAEFKKLQTFKGVTHVTADGEVTVRYYADNDSGNAVEMLHGMVADVEEEVNEQHNISSNVCDISYYPGCTIQLLITKKNISKNSAIESNIHYTFFVNYDAYSAETVCQLVPDGFFPKEVFADNIMQGRCFSSDYGKCAYLDDAYNQYNYTTMEYFDIGYVVDGEYKGKVVCVLKPQANNVRRVFNLDDDMTNPIRDYAKDRTTVGLYNGKPLKQAVIEVNSLPNSTESEISYNMPMGLSGAQYGEIETVFIDEAHSYVTDASNNVYGVNTMDWMFSVNTSKLKVTTKIDASSYKATITLLYTNI